MFSNLGFGEIAMLALIALVVFGPERLPKVAADAGRLLRQLREMMRSTGADIRKEMGPEFANVGLRDLQPRRFVTKHLMADDSPFLRDAKDAQVMPQQPETSERD